jgi:PEP-CTERM motif
MSRKQIGATAGRRLVAACFAVVGILACLVNIAVADDDDIVNANGFELPFSTLAGGGTGRLEGQINPPGEGQVIPPGQWQRTPGGTSTAVVQTAVVASGLQAVRVDRAANNDVRWAVQVDHLGYPDYPNPFPPEPAQPCICISWDMRVQQTQGAPDTFGPFFGVEAYDDASAIGLLGSLGVDATTGELLYQATGTGVLTPTGDVVPFNQWNHYQIKLDYSTDQYSIFRNFAMEGTFGFVDPNLNQFSDADISALGAAGDPGSQALTGTAWYDNFLVREGACPIPEPNTFAMIGFGLATFAARRRRASRG